MTQTLDKSVYRYRGVGQHVPRLAKMMDDSDLKLTGTAVKITAKDL